MKSGIMSEAKTEYDDGIFVKAIDHRQKAKTLRGHPNRILDNTLFADML